MALISVATASLSCAALHASAREKSNQKHRNKNIAIRPRNFYAASSQCSAAGYSATGGRELGASIANCSLGDAAIALPLPLY